MNEGIKAFLQFMFGHKRAPRPIDCDDWTKDLFCSNYIRYIDLDNELADIREQTDKESLLKYFDDPGSYKNIIYSCLEQKLNDLVDEYNASLVQDDDIRPFNPNRAMEDAGHKKRDFF